MMKRTVDGSIVFIFLILIFTGRSYHEFKKMVDDYAAFWSERGDGMGGGYAAYGLR